MGLDVGKENYQGQTTQTYNDVNILPTLEEKIKFSNNQDFQNLNYNDQTLNLVNDNLLQETNVNSYNEIDDNQNIYPDTQTGETQVVFPTSFIQPERNQESSNFLENTDLDQFIQTSTATPKFNDSIPQEQNINIQENNGIEYSDTVPTNLQLYQTEYIGDGNNNVQTSVLEQPFEYDGSNTMYEKVSNFVSNNVNNVQDGIENIKENVQNAIPNPMDQIGNIGTNYMVNNIVGYAKPSSIYEKASNFVSNKVSNVKEGISNVKEKVQNIPNKIGNIGTKYMVNKMVGGNILNPIGSNLVTPAILGGNAIMNKANNIKEGINGTVARAFCNNNIPTIIKIEDEEKTPICPDFVCKIYKSIFG